MWGGQGWEVKIAVQKSDRKKEVSQEQREAKQTQEMHYQAGHSFTRNPASSRSERMCLEKPYGTTVSQNVLMCVGEWWKTSIMSPVSHWSEFGLIALTSGLCYLTSSLGQRDPAKIWVDWIWVLELGRALPQWTWWRSGRGWVFKCWKADHFLALLPS